MAVTRLVPHSAQGPLAVNKADIQGDAIWLCRCGLSKNGLTCDGSHKATLDEQPGQLYHYERRDGVLHRTSTALPPLPLIQESA